MTDAEFDRRVKALNLTSQALPAARAVLQGESVRAMARRYNVDPGHVSRLVARIRETELCPCCGQKKPALGGHQTEHMETG